MGIWESRSQPTSAKERPRVGFRTLLNHGKLNHKIASQTESKPLESPGEHENRLDRCMTWQIGSIVSPNSGVKIYWFPQRSPI